MGAARARLVDQFGQWLVETFPRNTSVGRPRVLVKPGMAWRGSRGRCIKTVAEKIGPKIAPKEKITVRSPRLAVPF